MGACGCRQVAVTVAVGIGAGRSNSGAAYGNEPGRKTCRGAGDARPEEENGVGRGKGEELRWRGGLWRIKEMLDIHAGSGVASSSSSSSSLSSSPQTLVIPKSAILQPPISSTSTFSSLISLWTQRATSCRYLKPLTTCLNIIPASSWGSAGRPSRLRISNREPAGQYNVKK